MSLYAARHVTLYADTEQPSTQAKHSFSNFYGGTSSWPASRMSTPPSTAPTETPSPSWGRRAQSSYFATCADSPATPAAIATAPTANLDTARGEPSAITTTASNRLDQTGIAAVQGTDVVDRP